MARIAMLVGDGFEDSEVSVPVQRLREAGHEVVYLGSRAGETVHGKRGKEAVEIAATPAEFAVEDFDALVLPGGHGPDRLRTDSDVVRFTHDFVTSGRLVAAICHGPQLLIEAGTVADVTLTSWPSVRTDLLNAGAQWVDEQVVEDGNLITSRKPDDLEAFCAALLSRLP